MGPKNYVVVAQSESEQHVSHMVSYRGADGQPSYHETDDLGAAIAFVEHLRNNEAVDHARIFKMDEVGFEFRPYFRVEIAGTAAPEGMAAVWMAPAEEEAGDDRDPLVDAWAASAPPDDRAEEAISAGRRGLFGR